MNDTKRGRGDNLKNIPNWIKAAIALVTVIISFYVLIQKNVDLSIVIIFSAVLYLLMAYFLVIIFSKIDSPLQVGSKSWKYEQKWRRSGFEGLLSGCKVLRRDHKNASGKTGPIFIGAGF